MMMLQTFQNTMTYNLSISNEGMGGNLSKYHSSLGYSSNQASFSTKRLKNFVWNGNRIITTITQELQKIYDFVIKDQTTCIMTFQQKFPFVACLSVLNIYIICKYISGNINRKNRPLVALYIGLIYIIFFCTFFWWNSFSLSFCFMNSRTPKTIYFTRWQSTWLFFVFSPEKNMIGSISTLLLCFYIARKQAFLFLNNQKFKLPYTILNGFSIIILTKKGCLYVLVSVCMYVYSPYKI